MSADAIRPRLAADFAERDDTAARLMPPLSDIGRLVEVDDVDTVASILVGAVDVADLEFGIPV